MDVPFLLRLYDHMEWGDALLWSTVLAMEAAAADDFVMDSIVHLHLVQRAYLNLWRGEQIVPVGKDDFDSPSDARDWAREFYPAVRDFMAEAPPERLDEEIDTPWRSFIDERIGGPIAMATLRDMAFQVASHSVHHRAQINRRIRELGGEPPFIDYIGWVWSGCPDPEW